MNRNPAPASGAYEVHDATGYVTTTHTLQAAMARYDDLTREEPAFGPYKIVRLVPVQVLP